MGAQRAPTHSPSTRFTTCRPRIPGILSLRYTKARMPTYGREKKDIKFSAPPEPRRSKLGKFRPETRMLGYWVGYSALALAIGAVILGELGSRIAGFFLAAISVGLSVAGIRSKARATSWIAILISLIWILLTFLMSLGGEGG